MGLVHVVQSVALEASVPFSAALHSNSLLCTDMTAYVITYAVELPCNLLATVCDPSH